MCPKCAPAPSGVADGAGSVKPSCPRHPPRDPPDLVRRRRSPEGRFASLRDGPAAHLSPGRRRRREAGYGGGWIMSNCRGAGAGCRSRCLRADLLGSCGRIRRRAIRRGAAVGPGTRTCTAGGCPRTRRARSASRDSAARPHLDAPLDRGLERLPRRYEVAVRPDGVEVQVGERGVALSGGMPVHRPQLRVVRVAELIQVGRRGDPPSPLRDVVLLGIGRDDPLVHGRQEPAASGATAQYDALSAVQAPRVRLARVGAAARRDDDLAGAQAAQGSFDWSQERLNRLLWRRSRHDASAYERQRHEHFEQPRIGVGVDVFELAGIEGLQELWPTQLQRVARNPVEVGRRLGGAQLTYFNGCMALGDRHRHSPLRLCTGSSQGRPHVSVYRVPPTETTRAVAAGAPSHDRAGPVRERCRSSPPGAAADKLGRISFQRGYRSSSGYSPRPGNSEPGRLGNLRLVSEGLERGS